MIELTDGGYAWVDVLEVMDKKQKPFHEVKDEVKQFTIKQERARLIAELASKLVERADRGEAMAVLANAGGAAKVETTPPFNRTTEPQGMSKDAVARAFTLAKGKAGSAPDSNDKTRIIFKVTEITPPPAPTKEQRDRSPPNSGTPSPTRRSASTCWPCRSGSARTSTKRSSRRPLVPPPATTPSSHSERGPLEYARAHQENKARSNGSDADARRLRRAL